MWASISSASVLCRPVASSICGHGFDVAQGHGFYVGEEQRRSRTCRFRCTSKNASWRKLIRGPPHQVDILAHNAQGFFFKPVCSFRTLPSIRRRHERPPLRNATFLRELLTGLDRDKHLNGLTIASIRMLYRLLANFQPALLLSACRRG